MFKLYFIVLLILIPICSFADVWISFNKDFHYFLNPGIKVGWEFGKHKGPVLGLEFSTGAFSSGGFYGAVAGWQRNLFSKTNMTYFEGEIGSLLGFAFGMEKRTDLPYRNRLRIFGGIGGFGSLKYCTEDKTIETSFIGKGLYIPNGGLNNVFPKDKSVLN